MKKYINPTVMVLGVLTMLYLSLFEGKDEVKISDIDPKYEFKILAKSDNEYITIFEVDGQRFVYIYEGSLQKLD